MKWIRCFKFIFALPTIILCGDASAAVYPNMSGTVVDFATGKPIAGASVLVYRTKRVLRPPIEAGSELVEAKLSETDGNGSYRIGKFIKVLGPLEFKGDTVLVVYQPGYVFRLEDDSNGDSKEFPKDGNRIALRRVPANFDHGEHYQELERALWGIQDYYGPDSGASWRDLKTTALKGLPEKRSLLRRAEWENDRSRRAYDRK